MKTIIKKIDKENGVIWKLLVSSPYKYKELVYIIDTNLNLSLTKRNFSILYN